MMSRDPAGVKQRVRCTQGTKDSGCLVRSGWARGPGPAGRSRGYQTGGESGPRSYGLAPSPEVKENLLGFSEKEQQDEICVAES